MPSDYDDLAMLPELEDIDELEDADMPELSESDDGDDEMSEIDNELAAIESEFGGDDDELGAMSRRRVRSIRSRYRRSRRRSRQRYNRARKAAKKNARIAKKAVTVAKKYRTGAKKEYAIGRVTGFRGPTGTSFGVMGAADTTTTLTARPQKDVNGGQLVIDFVDSAAAAPGANVVKEIKIGVYPLLSSNDGVALNAFNQDSTLNVFSWPEAEVGNEITVEIERSVAPGAGETVTFTAALGPYIKTTPHA